MCQIALHRRLRARRQFRQHLDLEFAADDGGNLGELTGFAQPIETGEQAALQGIGNRQQLGRAMTLSFGILRRRHIRVGFAHLPDVARRRHRAGHFFDIERDSVGALHHLGQQGIRYRGAMNHVACQFDRLHRVQPVDGEVAHMPAGDAEIPVLAAGDEQQDRRHGRALDQRRQKRFRRGIDPVHIFHHHDLELRRRLCSTIWSTIAARRASSFWVGV